MTSAELLAAPPPPTAPAPVRSTRERTSSWPLVDRIAYALCWAVGIGLCVIALAIVAFMAVKGISYLKASMLTQSPQPSLLQKQSGGFRDPILGSLLITAIGIVIAAPLGVAVATWLSEYRRPAWLARAAESAIEIVAGTPSVVLALFGLLVFSQSFLGFLSQRAATGAVTGESFLTAGIVMSGIGLPLIVASARETLAQQPNQLREASYALGRTKATTIRRVLLPASRRGIATGVVLGMGRIIGDTAIITIVLGGAGGKLEPAGHTPILSLLRGVGSTLTSYVYYQSPAGDGNSHEKAYAAAFVLLLMVLALNALATRLARGSAADGGDRRRRPALRRPLLRWSR
ncbi:MAG TPA: ABC transporter permease subunit [Solirubrobacteraceae bacterium]|nr:ABC transporter permease subunit [Solirubrobacteraceae bacterium]